MKKCKNCRDEIKGSDVLYCSPQCVQNYKYKERVKLWLEGKHNGMRGKTATANWIKRYLVEQRGEKCEECGWNEINQYTKNIPIELEHIDGDFRNNKIENLKLLCPNCHSLTPTYKGANKDGRPRNQYNSRKK